MSETCGTCRFFHQKYPTFGVNPPSGQCRIRSLPKFPWRDATESCGEHQPKAPVATERQNVTLMETSLPDHPADRQEAEAWRRAAAEQFPHPGS